MKRIAILLLSSLILQLSAFAQGPLTPPGAPAPTMKTLEQVEPRTPITNLPYTISVPGSYYVTTNLTGNPGGITIAASGVTLDLMGFELVGGTGDGIVVSGSRTNIAVRNGTVRGWSGVGVNTLNASNSQLERLAVSQNGSRGIRAGRSSTINGCTALSNGSSGIDTDSGSTVSGCIARSNTGDGIIVAFSSTVSGCTAENNTSDGIITSFDCSVSGCTALSNDSDGIVAGSGGTISRCTAAFNTGDGIFAGTGSTVSGCTARSNTGDGIQVADDCHVAGNACDSNGLGVGNGAGIYVILAGNRIDGNNVTDADWGIKVDEPGNLIIRNSASGNTTNYFFIGTQTFGPTNTVTGEINPTNTSPWANFSF